MAKIPWNNTPSKSGIGMRKTKMLAIGAEAFFISGALFAFANAVDPAGVRGMMPSMEDIAPGVGRAGEQVPAMYVMAGTMLVGSSLFVGLVIRVFKGVETITSTYSKSIEANIKTHNENMQRVREDCHVHSLEMIKQAKEATADSKAASERCNRQAEATAAALAQCSEAFRDLKPFLKS